MLGAKSLWSAGKELSWKPQRIGRVCDVKYNNLQGVRFQQGTKFLRWRPERLPRTCAYEQLEVTKLFEVWKIPSA